MKRSDFCAQLDRMVAAMRDDADFLERTADRMEALDEARIPAYKRSGPITDRVHCAWCDGEGRCAGITLGSVCLNGADTSPEAVNAMAFRLATIEAYPFTSAKETMQHGAVMIRALAAERAELVQALHGFVRWANAKCPCENEQPNPCPLCGASVENFEGCKAADQTLPRELLEAARAAISTRAGSAL